LAAGETYEGSPDDLRDGFIHFSTAKQLPETLKKYFADKRDLMIIAVPVSALGATLKWEPARGGDSFAHLYGPLSTVIAKHVSSLPDEEVARAAFVDALE
jgi:uncharacterized protein (DUF952 family)